MGTTSEVVEAVHATVAEVQRLRAENRQLENALRDANREVGAQSMERKLAEAHVARLKDENGGLRAAVLAQLSILETLPSRATAADLHRAIDHATERLGLALYPESAKEAAQ